MAIKQTIEFNSDKEYFAGFLQNVIDESLIEGSVEFKDDKIELILNDKDGKALERFSNFTQKYLPHSLYLGKIDTQVVELEPKADKLISQPYKIAPCPICIEEITNPASQNYLDDTIECHHYANKDVVQDVDNSYFSPHFNAHDTTLIADASKIDELFIVTENEIKALFSIEKPTLKLTVKDEELKALTGKKFLRVQAPYNIKSSLAALNAKDSEITTLFFNQRENEPEIILVQDNMHFIYDNRASKALDNLSEDVVINRFLNIAKEPNYSETIGVNLSQKGISFIVKNEVGCKRAIEFQEFSLQKLLEDMSQDDKRSRLLNNFKNKFPQVSQKLDANLDLFKTIATILEIDEPSFETLSDKSLEFHGNGGLKIDMNFSEDGFDYPAMIGSIISFKLADVEPHYLAYSIFEAYGDMVVSVFSQLKKEFKLDKFILFGDIFSNSVVYSRILSKFQISKPYFSKEIALDFK